MLRTESFAYEFPVTGGVIAKTKEGFSSVGSKTPPNCDIPHFPNSLWEAQTEYVCIYHS